MNFNNCQQKHNIESLQNLCLKVIASNFDLFFRLFNSSYSGILHSTVNVLQKLYSEKLLKLLSNKNHLNNEHLSFLLNKYSHEVTVMYLINCDPVVIEERLQEIGNVITMFDMTGIKSFHCDNFVRHLLCVQVLRLGNTNCSNKSLALLSKHCKELETLDLYGCDRVTDVGLEMLCKSGPPLKNLNVEYTSVSYKGVALALKSLPTLSKVMFDNMPRAVFEATGLNESPTSDCGVTFNLSNMVILNNPMRPENHLTAILNVCTKSCPYIQNLVVSEIITEEQLRLISSFQKLEVVSLLCSTVVNPKLCINGFLQIRGDKLTILSLTSFSLSIELIARRCPNLVSLSLQHPSFEDKQDFSASFPCLKIFSIQNLSMDQGKDHVTCVISSSPKLEELHIVHCQFSDSVKNAILQCPTKLTLLNFSNTFVNLEYLEELILKHKTLEKLILRNSGIDSNDYDDLMDIVDEMERKVVISWADYAEAIRELFNLDDSVFNNVQNRYILKL